MSGARVMEAAQAAALVRSGDTVAISGVVSLLSTEAVLRALQERFADTGEPAGLTVICPCRTGWSVVGETTGLEHLAAPGMVKTLIASSYNVRDTPTLMASVMDGRIATYVLPMGVMYRWLRECAARSPGLLTHVGLNTYFDPDGGDVRVHPSVPPLDLLQRMEIDGEPCMLLRSKRIDVAIVRGSVADEHGNISLEDEPISGSVRHLAMAARTSGGRVIAVVKRIVAAGSLHPRNVEIPGIWVDAVVVDADAIQTQLGDEPAFTGAKREAPMPQPMALDQQKIIVRRAAMELQARDIVNLGVGMGSQLPSVLAEEGALGDITFSVEHGALGGIPAMGVPGQTGAFGAHFNPDAIVDAADLMDFYHGGGLDATLLGFAQIDGQGSVNVGRFDGNIRGPGGFVDITYRTRKVLLCGTLNSGGLQVRVDRSSTGTPILHIEREGRHRKLLANLEQVNLHGPSAFERGTHVRVITERCVFALDDHGLVLIEVAPGIDIDTQIRPHLEFALRVSPDCKAMDARLFSSEPMGLQLPARPETLN
ncbi:CoA-transferase [Caenimonas sp. SL110]|uniref:CoA-transferase n=1 Tax=Caenimonas sp. SL110 TaxID=1450524 RepID=UPI000652C8EF|nr:CoA-transferase [Caenimonas sp. SL110]